MGVAAALAGAAVVGAYATNKATNKSISAQQNAAETASSQTTASAKEAKGDLFKLFPAAQQNSQQGFQGALDVFGQSLPAQTQAFQQGNVGAQQQLINALPQMQNAILGNQVDLSGFQPTQIETPNLGFFQQQLPDFINPYEQPAQQAQQPIRDVLPNKDYIHPSNRAGFNSIQGFF
jgi:hypothetical protein